ncbi:MAG: deoxyribose-phosphate aldolase [Ruminococcaceae bacterium]|nr:deoxyribose-phosphate aldolase [Oscillospiraceae bacterium]
MDIKEILKICDHTLLLQTATEPEIIALCDDALKFGVASVCVPPCYVKLAAEYLKGRVAVCTVVGFPNGNTTTASKCFETREAVENGADEIDMVINIGYLRNGDYNYVANEISAVRESCVGKILKVIIETCLLTDEEKIKMCRIVYDSGADYIKTSTGFSKGGATKEDVALFAENIPQGLKIKAAGGISSIADAEDFINFGASRLGTSRIVKIAKETQE